MAESPEALGVSACRHCCPPSLSLGRIKQAGFFALLFCEEQRALVSFWEELGSADQALGSESSVEERGQDGPETPVHDT